MNLYLEASEIDTSQNDSVYILLKKQNTFAASTSLAAAYLAEHKYDSAQSIINSLSPVTIEDQAEMEILLLLHAVYSVGRDVFSLTELEEQKVRSIADLGTDCPARANAKVILFVVFGEPLQIEMLDATSRLGSPEQQDSVVVEYFLGDAYPNPADQNVNFSCHLPVEETSIFQVFDITGKLVYSQSFSSDTRLITINTAEWSNGVYLCMLKTDVKIFGQQKIIIGNSE